MCWDLTNKEAFDKIAWMLANKPMPEDEYKALIRALQVFLENKETIYKSNINLKELVDGTDI